MENNLKIPYDKRYNFAEPLDILIAGTREETISELENIFKDYAKSSENLVIHFYLVGDIVTKDFLSNQFLKSFIKICIIDEKTKRAQIKIEFKGFFDEIIEFQNPEGTIQKESWSLLRDIIISKKKTLIKITEGEEDLLVIPLVLELPIEEKNVKNFVFYGQPPVTDSKFNIPEGIAIVHVDKNIKNKVKKLLELMEKI